MLSCVILSNSSQLCNTLTCMYRWRKGFEIIILIFFFIYLPLSYSFVYMGLNVIFRSVSVTHYRINYKILFFYTITIYKMDKSLLIRIISSILEIFENCYIIIHGILYMIEFSFHVTLKKSTEYFLIFIYNMLL